VPGSYSKPATGKCENTGGETMTSLAACKTAATKLGLGRVEVGNSKGWSHVPPGCSMWGSVVHFNYKKTTRSCDYSASKYCICKEMTGDNRKYLPFWSTKTTSGGSRYEKYKNGCCHNTKSDKAAWGRKFKIYIIQEGTKCLVLPMSMNGGKHPRGCPGAVWSSGSPAGSYCNGKGGKYPWWRDCCQWKDGSCKPKSVAVHQDVVASWDEKKYGKNGVDLVVKYIQRWVKGAVGSTCDTTCGAKGLMCDSDAQTKLNTNEKVKAAFAEAGYTCKSFHPARTYGGTPFSTGRAKDDCTPFLAGAKRSVCDSNPHKNHAPLCSCM